MTAFENFVYSILDVCISSDAALVIFLLGGFVLCGMFSILLLIPWLREMPHRFSVAAGAAIPVIVLIYAQVFDLLVSGRKTGIMLALSPVMLAFVPSVLSLIDTVRRKSMNRRTRVIVALSCVLVAQLWAILVLWLATNYGFMGASC